MNSERIHRSFFRPSLRPVPRNLNCFWTNGTSLTDSLTHSLIHSFSHKSLIPSRICPLLHICCFRISSTAKSELDSLDREEEEEEESSEKEREADNFWHESHKTLRGEQIINSNSTKKMAAAAFAVVDGDAVATNSPLLRLSHSENMYVHIRSQRERERNKSLPRSPPSAPAPLGAPWKM